MKEVIDMPKNWNGSWPKAPGNPINSNDLNDIKTNIEYVTLETISSSVTLALADAGTVKNCTNGSAITITIPSNNSVTYPIGTEIGFIRQGAGTISFAPASGVTLQSIDTKRRIKGQFGAAAIVKTATDTWSLTGSLEA
jgi:hypothetical protein